MEPQRLGPLIDRLSGPLGLYARQWCETPEDVVQEAFLKLAGLARPPENPDAWLFRAVRNGAINAGVANRRRRRREAEAAVLSDAWFDPGSPQARAATIDPESAQAALATLPDDQREVIVAHLWGGLSFAQVAELSGISSSSAHRLYHAGLSALRERLEVPCRPTTTRD
jgi:RNA polymerase sigma-70 factor (ECF subfamily)